MPHMLATMFILPLLVWAILRKIKIRPAHVPFVSNHTYFHIGMENSLTHMKYELPSKIYLNGMGYSFLGQELN
jgi:hypothetical protein